MALAAPFFESFLPYATYCGSKISRRSEKLAPSDVESREFIEQSSSDGV